MTKLDLRAIGPDYRKGSYRMYVNPKYYTDVVRPKLGRLNRCHWCGGFTRDPNQDIKYHKKCLQAKHRCRADR